MSSSASSASSGGTKSAAGEALTMLPPMVAIFLTWWPATTPAASTSADKWPWKARMTLDRAVGGERAEREAFRRLCNACQARQSADIDQVCRCGLLAVDLNHQIGAAGDKSCTGTQSPGQVDCIRNRGRMVKVEAHLPTPSAA